MDTTMPDLPDLDELDKELKPGHKVGEYVIEGRLGAGGFGTVFRASHPVIGKLVAIKVLNRQFSVQREMVSRFVAEARAVNQIRHRNIIDIFGFGTLEDGRHYYVMELLDGATLGEHLEKVRRMPLREALPILRAVGKALDAAHAKGIAHRDLKPENIFLASDPDGGFFPKLLDFGIAKLLVGDDTGAGKGTNHKTRTGAPIGTPLYMSPEQCRGRDVDHRTDIYAFGIVAFRMLTGKLPFDADDYMTILMQQMSDPPPVPSSLVAELPAGIDRAITWMLAKEPAARPGSLMKAVEALEHAAAEVGVESPTWTATPPLGSLGRDATGGRGGRAGERAASETGQTLPASSLRGGGLGEANPGEGRGAGDLRRELGGAATLDSAQMTVPAISGARNTTPDVVPPDHARPMGRGKLLVAIVLGGLAAVVVTGVVIAMILRGQERAAARKPDARTASADAAAAKGATEVQGKPDAGSEVRNEARSEVRREARSEARSEARVDGGLAEASPDAAAGDDADTVRLTFTGLPDNAVVYGADHRALGLVGQGVSLPRSTDELTLTFELDGRVLAKKKVRPEADAQLAVELTKAGNGTRRPRPDRGKPRPGSPEATDPNSTERPPGL